MPIITPAMRLAILTLATLFTGGAAADPTPSCHFAGAMCGYVSASGEVQIAPRFDNADPFVEGRAKVQIDGKYGLIDPQGREVADVVYDFVSAYWRGYALLRKDGMTSLIDRDGTVILQDAADHIIPLDADHILLGSARHPLNSQPLACATLSECWMARGRS